MKKKEQERKGENSANMQRSIMSFFQPTTEGKAKKPEKEIPSSIREKEPPPKVALKERNRAVPESDSPVKRPGRKVAQVLSSEGEDEDEAPGTPEVQKPVSDSKQSSPPSPDSCPENSSPSMDISPSGFPKRRTARKQLPKRTIQDSLEEHNEDKDKAAKKRKKEEDTQTPTESLREAEEVKQKEEQVEDQPTVPPGPTESPESVTLTKTENIPMCKAGVKQKPQEEEQSKPPARGAKPLSSFFTPRKPAVKTEVKQEESDTPRKEETKGAPDPTNYNPSKSNYHPIEDACWKHGQKVPFLAVARTFEKIEEVSARLKMVETLSNLLRSVVALSPTDLLPVLYLSLNRLGPPQQGLELGVGDGVLLKAVAQATGRQLESIRAEVAEKGDVGLVAENSRSTQRLMLPPPPLTVSGVFTKFCDIARLTGSASMAKKMDIIKGLFVACRYSEARFIARSLSGRLRLGLAEQSVLAALAQAVSLTPPGQEFPTAVVDAGKGKTAEARKMWLEEQGMILKQTFW